MSEEETNKPKIIVDDDWKSRAQAEKEQLQQQAAGRGQEEPVEASKDDSPNAPESDANAQLPPASFSVLVTTLATQALATMGQIPGEDGKPMVQLAHAKHFIDTLSVLEEKTKGNLEADEMVMLSNVLHELRMMFVAIGKQLASPPNESSE